VRRSGAAAKLLSAASFLNGTQTSTSTHQNVAPGHFDGKYDKLK
jgi:hypothetical protein